MKSIYKYELAITDSQQIAMPAGSKILTAQAQNGVVCLWAEVDADVKEEFRHFRFVGTGHQLPDGLRYIATVQTAIFVWHVYEAIGV